jgi:hypothetical protein
VIQRKFEEPNYKCRISEPDGTKEREIVLYASDPNDARKRLERRNFKILSDPVPYDFSEWKSRAKAKTDAAADAIKKKENYDFGKNAIWGELKDHLFDLFDLKCAYCENTMLGAYWGDVEHYRPKNPVSGDPAHKEHPGYFWLAYEPENYVPACNKCNQPKSNRFPLAPRSPRAYTADEVKNEKPLLLNPYTDDPAKHLTFQFSETDNRAGAWATGLTEAGKATRDLLQLNRGDLLTERRLQQNIALGDYFVSRRLGLTPNPVIEQLKIGERPFSLASMVTINAVLQAYPG